MWSHYRMPFRIFSFNMIRNSALNITAFLLLRMFVEVSSKVYFFTYLTAVTNSMPCSSIRSALSNGIQLTVLGLPKHGILGNSGSISLDPTECNTIELLKHLEYGKGFIFSPDDIVVFNDGTDVLYAGSEDQVEAAFVTIEKSDTILFSSERTCWPGTIPCIELDKSIPSSFKYANSGGFIARYQVMMKFLPLWVKLLGAQSGGLRDDQLALHHYQTESNQHSGIKTEIDHNCTIFQTTSGTNLQTSKWAVSDPVGPYVRADGTIYNSETKTQPLFIHFNRNNERMSSIERSMAINHHKRMGNESKYEKNCKSLMRKSPFIHACETEEKISRSIKFSCHAEDNPDGTTEFNAPDQASSDEYVWFPSRIFPFNIRRDVTSGRPVSRNRVKLLDPGIRYTVKEYNKILQCARVQPELHGKGGALSLARHIPLTSNTLTLVAAFLESNCRLWIDCYPQVKRMMSGKYSDHLDNTASLSGLSSAVMFRIMNGSLYTDWPWGSHRFKKNHDSGNDLNYKFIIREVVGRVSDLPDSVFFAAGEIALLPSNIPVPLFSSSPSGSTSSDIPGMWNQAYQIEVQRYRNGVFNSTVEVSDQRLLDLHTSNSSNAAIPPPSTWTQRKDKAAFFGSMTDDGFIGEHVIARQVVINIALEHPEDVEALYNLCFQLTDINPASTKHTNCHFKEQEWAELYINNSGPSTAAFGTAQKSLQGHQTASISMADYMLSYKYLIVIGGLASADRLNTFLAHSGAIILLQETDFLYHYSAFLKPWVHYVPLAVNAADLLEKIQWLKSHPRHAERLALNARNFGASYLRLEDYYCYTAAALRAVAKAAGPSALVPFNATLIYSSA